MVLVADRKHERRQQSSACVIKFVSAHRFVDVPHRDCPPTAARNLALFECRLQQLMRRLQPLPNVFLHLYNNSLSRVRKLPVVIAFFSARRCPLVSLIDTEFDQEESQYQWFALKPVSLNRVVFAGNEGCMVTNVPHGP